MNTPSQEEKNVELSLHEEPQQKPIAVVTLDELRRRQLREAKKEAFWAGRNLAARQSARRAA